MEKYQVTSSRMDKNKYRHLSIFLDDMVYITYEITEAGKTKISMQFIKFPLHHVKAHKHAQSHRICVSQRNTL
jgi:hypothetical protein